MSGFSTTRKRLVSSANNLMFEPISFTISFIYRRNSSGPRMDPCGIPHKWSSNRNVCLEGWLFVSFQKDSYWTRIEGYQKCQLLLIYKEDPCARHGQKPCWHHRRQHVLPYLSLKLDRKYCRFVCLFDLILNVHSTIFQLCGTGKVL